MKPMPVLTALVVIAGSAFAQDGASWPMYRGAKQDGISNETGWTTEWPATGPRILWKARIGNGFSSVAIAQGRLYTMGNRKDRDIVWCRDAATGDEIWQFSYDSRGEGYPGPRATPTVDGDRVYAVSRQAVLHCLDAETGKVVWKQDLRETLGARAPIHGYSSSPVVFEKFLIVQAGATDGAVAALDKADGKLVWKSGEGESGYSSPVLYEKDGTTCVAMFAGDALLGLDARTGRTLYRFPFPVLLNQAIANAIVSDGRVFLSAGYGAGAALVDVRGEPKAAWKTVEFSNQFATSVLWKGCLYGFDGDNERKPFLKCIEWATGRVMWSKDGFAKGSLTLAAGKLIVLGGSGTLVIADASPDGYRELARAKIINGVCWTMPVLCAGRIYCRSQDGDLVCVDVSGK